MLHGCLLLNPYWYSHSRRHTSGIWRTLLGRCCLDGNLLRFRILVLRLEPSATSWMEARRQILKVIMVVLSLRASGCAVGHSW